MEKIDLSKIRGKWVEMEMVMPYTARAGGDDTVESIKMVAEKVNEIIDLSTTNT